MRKDVFFLRLFAGCCFMLIASGCGSFHVKNVEGIQCAAYNSKFAALQAEMVKEAKVDIEETNAVRVKYNEFAAGQYAYLVAVKSRTHASYVVDESAAGYNADPVSDKYKKFISAAEGLISLPKTVNRTFDVKLNDSVKLQEYMEQYNSRSFAVIAPLAIGAVKDAIEIAAKIKELNDKAIEEAYQRFASEIDAAEPVDWDNIKISGKEQAKKKESCK